MPFSLSVPAWLTIGFSVRNWLDLSDEWQHRVAHRARKLRE